MKKMKKMLDPYKDTAENPDALTGADLLDAQLLTWAIDTNNLERYSGVHTRGQLDEILAEMKRGRQHTNAWAELNNKQETQ